jgi:hypothetical protein
LVLVARRAIDAVLANESKMRLIELVFDFIKGIAWPALIGGIVWLCRVQLQAILVEIKAMLHERGWEIGPQGLSVMPPAGQRAVPPTDVSVDQLPTAAQNVPPFIQAISGDQLNPVINAFRNSTPANLNEADKSNYFVATAAALHIQLQHERHYIAMFGSQIVLLKRLNEVGTVGLPVEVARTIYDQAVAVFPIAYQTYSFDQWLGFLVNAGLITLQGNTLMVTPYGNGFLQYMVQRQLSELKAF